MSNPPGVIPSNAGSADEPVGWGAACDQPRMAVRWCWSMPLAPISTSGPLLPPLSKRTASPMRGASRCPPAKARAPSPPTRSPSANSTTTSLAISAPERSTRSDSISAATGAALAAAPTLRSVVS